MLAFPDPSKPFYLHCDASIFSLGVCLMQKDDKLGCFRPVGYASRALLDREKRYVISELEALSIVFSLHYFKYCIHGCDIIVVTDHSALIYLMDRKEPRSNRMYCWRMEIADFASCGGLLKFVYKPGAHHKVPDGLSCNPLPLDEVPPELTDKNRSSGSQQKRLSTTKTIQIRSVKMAWQAVRLRRQEQGTLTNQKDFKFQT